MAKTIIDQKTKTCTKCKEEKPLSFFHKHCGRKDGLSNWCKICAIENVKKHALKNQNKKAEYIKKWREENPSYNSEYYARNPKKHNIRFKKWAKENPEKNKKRISDWATQNKAWVNEKTMRRAASKKQATPKWVDLSEIRLFYEASLAFKLYTGQEYHVDHIVPLQSKLVCGLHVPANLQILTMAENISKKNYRWPDMWT